MKSQKDRNIASNFVYDDDTSDSDEDNLEVFRSKVGSLQPGPGDLLNDVEARDAEESDENDESQEEDSSDSDSNDAEFTVAPAQLTEDKKKKLSKIQDQLAGIGGQDEEEEEEEEDEENEEEDGNDESDEDEIKGVPESEQNSDMDNLGTESESNESDKTDEAETRVSIQTRKRPLEKKISGSPDKKSKLEGQHNDVSEADPKTKFRAKLSKMSIEEIQRLKNKLGLKLFDQKMSGTEKNNKKVDYKRDNKNRPREMSSKRQVGRFREVISVSTEVKAPKRDPRFDPTCGEYNEKLFKDNYDFVNKYKVSDLKFLKKQLQEEEDPERKNQIKYLIQRTENQLRQLNQDKEKEMEKKVENEERKAQLRAGIKPVYISKSKQKEKDLVKKYEKLKESGGLDNYIKKKTKKNVAKDRKRFHKL